MRSTVHAVLVAVVVLAGAAAVAVLALLPRSAPPDAGADPNVTLRDAELIAVEPAGGDDVLGLAPGAEPLVLTARLDTGDEVTFEMIDETGDTFEVGQSVRLAEAAGPEGGVTYYVSDIDRDRPLLILAAVFLVAVLAFGRWQGVRALLGLAITLGVVIGVVIPALVAGNDPVVVAISASVAIMVVTLYITHGVRPKTTAAVVGTLVALGITVALSWAFIELASLTGLSSEEARLASIQVGGLSLRGLLLAGIIIGALGVLDDVTIAQSSTVFGLRAADPDTDAVQLFSRAMTVGRDHVASTINTLFLAYAGASLPLLLLFSGSPDSLGQVASSEIVAIEVVRTLVGSIGLIASVPLTTLLAAWLAREPTPVAAAVPRGDARTVGRQARPDQPDTGEPAGRDVGAVLGGARPFSPDDAPDSDWEERLRRSYGLDRRSRTRD